MKTLLMFFSLFSLTVHQVPRLCHIEIHPNLAIIFVGESIYFSCQGWNSDDRVTIKWHINGSTLNKSLTNVQEVHDPSPTVKQLLIRNSSVNWNNTEISCLVIYPTITCTSETSNLLLQGNLTEKSNVNVELNINCLSNGTLYLNWSQPFTLNLTFYEDGDIINYKVKILYSSLQLLLAEENISITSLEIPLPEANPNNASCNYVNISVLPYNEVGDGILTMTVKSFLTIGNIKVTQIAAVYIGLNSLLFKFQYDDGICGVEFLLTDINNNSVNLSKENVCVKNNCSFNTLVTITTLNSGLNENQHYNVTHFLTNRDGLIFGSLENSISTYDIQYILGLNEDNSSVKLNFLENSSAAGALLLLKSLKSDTVFFVTLNRMECQHINLTSFSAESILAVYDIENDGKLRSGNNVPAILKQHIQLTEIKYESQNQSSISTNIQQCYVDSINAEVTLNCECIESINVIGYQALLLYNNAIDGAIYVNSSECSMEVVLPVNRNSSFSIIVFSIEQIKGITKFEAFLVKPERISTDSNTRFTSVVIIVVAGVIFLICIFIIIYICKRRKKSTEVQENQREQCSQESFQQHSRDKGESSTVIKMNKINADDEGYDESEDKNISDVQNSVESKGNLQDSNATSGIGSSTHSNSSGIIFNTEDRKNVADSTNCASRYNQLLGIAPDGKIIKDSKETPDATPTPHSNTNECDTFTKSNHLETGKPTAPRDENKDKDFIEYEEAIPL